MKSEIIFSENAWKKLEEVETDSTALLFGWEKLQSLYCIGCMDVPPNWDLSDNVSVNVRKLLGQIPCGFKIIGLFYASKVEAIRSDCKTALDKLITPADLEDYLTDPLLIYVWRRIDDTTITFLYDTESEIITDANIDVRQIDLQSELTFMRVLGGITLRFDLDTNFEGTQLNLWNSIENVKKKILSPCCVFHLENTSLLLHYSTDDIFSHVDLKPNSECGSLKHFKTNKLEDKKEKKAFSPEILDFKMMFLTTGKQAADGSISCVPVIRYERRSFEAIALNISIDIMGNVPNSLLISKLSHTLSLGICCQLDLMGHSILDYYKDKKVITLPEIYHFIVPNCDHYISVTYPWDVPEDELKSVRRETHEKFYLPINKPLIRRSMRYLQETKSDGYLRNVHIGLPPSGVKGLHGLVYGTYTYHHYMQDGMNDDGWGCAYRSLQTVVSWFRHQGYSDRSVPSHVEIQKTLVDLGDKPASFINSKQWIGSMEVGFCLESLLGVSSKYITVNSGSELASKGRELVNHFNTQGTPIMIGGGVLAHTIIGVDFDVNSGDIKFLILDPHYTGEENLSVIQKKGWCGWKGIQFWSKTAFYNLCCPQRPIGI